MSIGSDCQTLYTREMYGFQYKSLLFEFKIMYVHDKFIIYIIMLTYCLQVIL